MRLTIREARVDDLDMMLTGVRDLLRELSGDPGRELSAGAFQAARAIIEDRALGTFLVAVTGTGEAAGILGASCQAAIRTGGRYLLIQELYVYPGNRGIGVGDRLIRYLVDDAVRRGLTLIEVGLPGPDSTHQSRTLDFYRGRGFTEVGPRMRHQVVEKEWADD